MTTATAERMQPAISRAGSPMTMLNDETVARPATRSPDAKAALAYLTASGATAVSVVETETWYAFHVGSKVIDPNSAAIFWIMEADAKPVVARARKLAGKSPAADDAMAALRQAATDLRATLTPHATAMARGGAAAERLDGYIESLRARGAMREFTKTYRLRRMSAKARGEGFMSFKVAELRLRQALIQLLVNGGQAVGRVQSLFEQIFDR